MQPVFLRTWWTAPSYVVVKTQFFSWPVSSRTRDSAAPDERHQIDEWSDYVEMFIEQVNKSRFGVILCDCSYQSTTIRRLCFSIHLINIKHQRLRITLPHLPILPLQTNPHNPHRRDRDRGKRNSRHPRLQEPRIIAARPQIRRINTAHIAQAIAKRQSNGFLLRCLAERRRSPAKHDIVDAETERDEDEDCDEARGHVGGHGGDDEADDNEGFADGDVPCALVVAAGSVGHGDCHGGCEQVWRACEREGDGGAVA